MAAAPGGSSLVALEAELQRLLQEELQQLDAHAQTRSELAAKAKELAEATGPAQAPQLTPF